MENYKIYLRGEALRWENLDEDIHISSFDQTAERNSDNEVARLFRTFPQLNVEVFAQQLSVAPELLWLYIYGHKTPKPERLLEIKEGFRALGRELMNV